MGSAPHGPLPGAAVLTVEQLVRAVRARVEADAVFSGIWVRGELSTYKLHGPSGHRYFTLKENQVSIRGVMFVSQGRLLTFEPEAGMDVLVRGAVTVYERDGSVEFIAREMVPAGVGAQYLALEALRRKLEAEGLFAPERKRPLPYLPRRIGVVTSLSGAALRDIIAVVRRRMSSIDLVVAPCQVQGADAPSQVADALARMSDANVDVVIVGRGGGAVEDLSAFNAENVVRAVAACPVPVIAAVGHQTDWTLVDFAADRRAPTPSAAAELAAPDVYELRRHVLNERVRLMRALTQRHQREALRLAGLLRSAALQRPRLRVERERLRLSGDVRSLGAAMQSLRDLARHRLVRSTERLEALSPLKVFLRGYAVVRDAQGEPVTRVRVLHTGDAIRVDMQDGTLDATVSRIAVANGAGALEAESQGGSA